MNRYLAFISYRHLPDSNDAALRLRKGLEVYHLPKDCPLPKRRRVFRDSDELPTSSDLGKDIENALRDSEYLIALCTEEYIHSKWCLREIDTYIESGRKDRILPVLLSGTPETSIPKQIRDLPVAADLRAGTSGAEKNSYDRKKMKTAVPELLAVMSGIDPDRIAGAEFRFRAFAAAGAASFLTAGLLGFAGYASWTADRIAENNVRIAEAKQETEKEEHQALKERDTALLKQAEYLAEQAWVALGQEDSQQAIQLALQALPEDLHGDLPVSPEAVGVLRVAMSMENPPSYHLSHTAETDFDIHGFYFYPFVDDSIFLLGERFQEAQPYADCMGETGVLTTDFSESRRKAIEAGYTGLLHLSGDANARRHYYYGPGKQMYCEGTSGSYHVDFCLEEEPFCAAGAVLDQDNGDVVAWEDPAETENARTALFRRSEKEAVTELDIEGIPVSVSFSGNSSLFCVVDESGSLSIYDRNGVKQKTLPGNYTDVYYFYSSSSCACAGSEDGTVTVLNLETFEEKLRFVCPAPVRQVRVNRNKGCILVRCDSGVFLYSLLNGSLITEIGSGAVPNYAVWKNDIGNNSSYADMILLIYDRLIEFYSIDTDIDSSVTDYIPLSHEGVPKGTNMVYSRDGKRIYQHSYLQNMYVHDPGNDMMYCWDAHTGDLLWESANPWYCYGSVTSPSEDGKTIWRVYQGNIQAGIERLDGETGKQLLYALWPGKNWQPMSGQPVESPDGARAFLTMQKSSTSTNNRTEMLVVFDTGTGEMLWRLDLERESAEWREENEKTAGEIHAAVPELDYAVVPICEKQREAGTFRTTEELKEAGLVLPEERFGFAEVMFSKDGNCLYCIQKVIKKNEGSGLCVDRLDTETGAILTEYILPLDQQKIILWEEEESVVLIGEGPDEVNTADMSVYSNGEWSYPSYVGAARGVKTEHSVRIFDLAKGEYTAEVPFSYLRSPEAYNQPLNAVRPYAGGMALIWEAENEDGDGEKYCCSLAKDGSLGPVFPADSEEGMHLRVSKDNYLHFNGEEAFLSQGRILRLSDGALLLQSAWISSLNIIQQGSGVLFTEGTSVDKGIAAAKDGSSICMFSSYGGAARTPLLILPSDLDTLVEKAKRRIAAGS